jgi:hypothetical protein
VPGHVAMLRVAHASASASSRGVGVDGATQRPEHTHRWARSRTLRRRTILRTFEPGLVLCAESRYLARMAHPDHNAIVAAFAAHPGVQTCHRGAPNVGYTHIHGPSQPHHATMCTTHSVVVEQFNGTLSLRDPVGLALGFAQRVPHPIATHPLGYSRGPNFGAFGYGLDAAEILRRWGSWAAFVCDIVAIEVARQRW